MPSRKMRRTAAVVVAAVTTSGLVAGGGARAQSGDYDIGTGPVTIKMKNRGKRTFFRGPERISRGARLTIGNVSNPKKIGPHTFTLVKASRVPRGRKEFKACGDGKGVCGRVAAAHELNPRTNRVHKPDVDVGRTGWNKSFGKTGDTWYTVTKGDTETRKVTVPVGTTLSYFCAVHPNMHGELKVVD